MSTTSNGGRLPEILPMPANNYTNQMTPFPSFGAQTNNGTQAQYMAKDPEPTHVVGSQGRRGVLPSDPGRAAPPAPGSVTANKSMIPAKDADGKYPCPHCNKSYLHAKHLKRHLLRRRYNGCASSSLTDSSFQTLETGLTNAIFAKTPLAAVTY